MTRSIGSEATAERVAAALHTLGLRNHDRRDGVRLQALGGGCIHAVSRVDFDDATGDVRTIVIKMTGAGGGPFMEAEAHGLRQLAQTRSVRVPRVFGVIHEGGGNDGALLVIEHLERRSTASAAQWTDFGRRLAAMHAFDHGADRRYGDDRDGVLGTTAQANAWCDDWIEFVRTRRLGPMLEALRAADLLRSDEATTIERAIDALDRLLIPDPHPARLHGDLWSGNVLPTDDGVAAIDPAHFVGDPFAEVGIMELFGGFPAEAIGAYRDAAATGAIGSTDRAESRIAVFRLHHLLNHVLIFGRGYADQALGEARRLARG